MDLKSPGGGCGSFGHTIPEITATMAKIKKPRERFEEILADEQAQRDCVGEQISARMSKENKEALKSTMRKSPVLFTTESVAEWLGLQAQLLRDWIQSSGR